MKNVTLRQLRAFAAVASHANFARAAAELHLTPPAVSMQIKELETEVGLPLFDRESRQVSLTLTGEYLLTYARRVLAELKDAQDMVATLRKLEGGVLVIGMVSSAQQFLPALMGAFRAEHRDVSLRLRVGNREQLATWMRANELDLAVMGRPPREIATRAEPFATNPLVLVTAANHPFVHMEQVSALRVSTETLLLREAGSGTRAAMEDYLREHHLHAGHTMELPSNETIKQAVMAGLGVSLMSLHSLGLELKQGAIATPEVEGLPILRRWYLVKNHGKTLSPAAEAFRYFLLEQAQSHLQRLGTVDLTAR
ncbi:MAG TPA: LysR family transcriptional regulator [Burkholderiaceae bacterium]|nr:LysR family transcriptional regulator [Burkholderiaceae bacterium]